MKPSTTISSFIFLKQIFPGNSRFSVIPILLFTFIFTAAVSCTGKGKEVKSQVSYGVNPGGQLGCPSTITVSGKVCHDAGDAIGAALKFQQECERIYSCATADPACTKTVVVTNITQTNTACEGNKKEFSCTAEITCKL